MGDNLDAPTTSDGLSSFGSSQQAVSPADAASIPSADWIEWTGGECPVDSETLVDAKFRDGHIAYAGRAGVWAIGICCWKHEGKFRAYDIIAYRVVQS